MATVPYIAKVQKNGSLTLSKAAQEVLDLRPGDEIEIHVDSEAIQREHKELQHAIDIGLEQFEQGKYSVYTKDTIQELVEEVKVEGRKRLDQAREKRTL